MSISVKEEPYYPSDNIAISSSSLPPTMAYPRYHLPGPGSMFSHPVPAPSCQHHNSAPMPPQQLLFDQTFPHSNVAQAYQHPQQPQQPQHNQLPSIFNMPAATDELSDPPPKVEPDDGEEEGRQEAARYAALPDPPSISQELHYHAYELRVEQQPERARMCGFGDKDRRPISPPPCIRLIIYDTSSSPRREIDYNKIEDLSRYAIMVDLSHCEDFMQEKNIVTHAAQSPSISTVTTCAYPQTVANPTGNYPRPTPYMSNSSNGYTGYPTTQYSHGAATMNGHSQSGWSNGVAPLHFANSVSNYQYGGSSAPYASFPPTSGPYQPEARMTANATRGNGSTVQKNIIGTLAGNAFKLKDLDGKVGVWFVFQDVSIRTEGWSRLKFSLFDVKSRAGNPPEASQIDESLATSPPCLAQVFSKPFKVHSAKKFPGVKESTPLSKKFAEQGIKIPIRKDSGKDGEKAGQKRKRRGSQDDEDSGQEEEE